MPGPIAFRRSYFGFIGKPRVWLNNFPTIMWFRSFYNFSAMYQRLT